MNEKRGLLAGIAAIIVYNFLQYLGHDVWLLRDYHATAGIWRMREQIPVSMLLLGSSIYGALFTRFFIKFYEGSGLLDGVRFGTYATWLVALPQVLTMYAILPVGQPLAAKWLGLAFVENLALGVLVAAIYGTSAERRDAIPAKAAGA